MPRPAGLCALSLLLVACLDVPPPVPDAAPPGPDAGPPAAAVVDVRAFDARGEAWPLSGVPRTVTLIARTTVGVEDLEDWVVLRGPPDDELRDDLDEVPLRQANQALALPVQRQRVEDGVSLALARLTAGDVLTVALLGRARTEDGRRFPESWVEMLVVSDAPRAGADVLASWPPDGAASVPASMDALLIRFDAPVGGELLVFGSAGEVATTTAPTDCRAFGWPDGFCLAARPMAAMPLGPVTLTLGPELVDGTGAAPAPFRAVFEVSALPSFEAPPLLQTPCALDEIAIEGVCVLRGEDRISLRLRAAEPVRAFLEAGGQHDRTVAPRGEVSLRIEGLAPDEALEATLRWVGLGGHSQARVLPLSTTPPLMALTLTEVRADPHGREPAQELIEVLNFGDVPLDLNGISISDRPDALGDVVMGAAPLAPGARALLVGDDFDPEDAEDTPVPPGVALVRVGRSLASGGLSNAGEAVYLRDPLMRRLAYAPAVATGEGRCLQRADEGAPRSDAFVVSDCTPGRAP
ncbi:MAG: hypothetical protein AB8I08_40560 [Sandaracinaceae bacterium]